MTTWQASTSHPTPTFLPVYPNAKSPSQLKVKPTSPSDLKGTVQALGRNAGAIEMFDKALAHNPHTCI
jgi:hypothetical protein